jgi:hypothetical protein
VASVRAPGAVARLRAQPRTSPVEGQDSGECAAVSEISLRAVVTERQRRRQLTMWRPGQERLAVGLGERLASPVEGRLAVRVCSE